MTADREELHALIEGLADDQVEALLVKVRGLATGVPSHLWPPKFFGMLEDGPVNGSSPEDIDSVLAEGFGQDG